MLPTSGYFRSVNCPFFSSGLCERPHCHFRHVSAEPFAAPAPATITSATAKAAEMVTLPTQALPSISLATKPDLLSLVREAILQVQKEVVSDKGTDQHSYSATSTSSDVSALAGLAGLLGAGTSSTRTDSAGVIPVRAPGFVPQQRSRPKTLTAEYKPTPIAELKKLKTHGNVVGNASCASDFEYSPSSRSNSKILYVPESKSRRPLDASINYVPNPIVKERLNSRSSSSENNKEANKIDISATIVLSSDEDTDGDVGPAPHFSDDDDDDDVKCKNNVTVKQEDTSIKCEPSDDNALSGVKYESPTCAGSDKKFDLVNKILAESVAFDSMISAASVRHTEPEVKKPVNKSKGKAIRRVAKEGDDTKVAIAKKVVDEKTKTASSASATANTKAKTKTKATAIAAKKVAPIATSPTKNKFNAKSTTNSVDVALKETKSDNAAAKTTSPSSAVKSKQKIDGKAKIVNGSTTSDEAPGGGGMVKATPSVKTMMTTTTNKCVLAPGALASPKKSKLKVEDKSKASPSTGNRPAKKSVSNDLNEPSPKRMKTDDKSAVPAKKKVSTTQPTTLVATKAKSSSDEDLEQKSHEELTSGVDDDHEEEEEEEEEVDDEEYEDNDVDEECLKIFNEYTPNADDVAVSSAKKASEKTRCSEVERQMEIPGKIRVSHNPTVQRTVPVAKYKASPSQIMYERFLRVQQMVMEGRQKTALREAPIPRSKTIRGENSTDVIGKQRIAHIPNGTNSRSSDATSRGGTTCRPSTSSSSCAASAAAAATTTTKGNQRVSRVPENSSFVRPTIPADFGSRVPTNVRQRYLNFLIDECMVIYDNEQDACERGLVEEKIAYDRSLNRTVYLNVVANTIKKLRDEQPKNARSTGAAANQQRVVSHQFNLGGKKAANVSYSIERVKNKCSGGSMSGANLYKTLKKYLLTEEQLVDNGYPLPHPTEPFITVILKPFTKRNSTDPCDKVCSRCGASFKVSDVGTYLTRDECFYHWGRAHKVRTRGTFETRYSCCQAGLHSEGCCVGKLHVFDDIDNLNLKGFVKTLPKSPPPDDNYGIYALDCEMCYTNMGNELTRVTVVDANSKPVFESLVKPENAIIDYNTKFSGITESDLVDVHTTLRDVQAIILSKFSDKTILIGHSLESDFKALKLIHKTVIDTSVVFPHKLGPPYKRALRNLVAEYLKKIIQNDVAGHDSQEDAASCMQLMLWKAKEDMKMVY